MTGANLLRRGDPVPHFEVRSVGGQVLPYSDIWQRSTLVLVTVPAAGTDGEYVAELTARGMEFHAHGTACVITPDGIAGLPAPGVLVADRWGEIAHVATGSTMADLPSPAELLEWVEYLEHRCPECEGEAR